MATSSNKTKHFHEITELTPTSGVKVAHSNVYRDGSLRVYEVMLSVSGTKNQGETIASGFDIPIGTYNYANTAIATDMSYHSDNLYPFQVDGDGYLKCQRQLKDCTVRCTLMYLAK